MENKNMKLAKLRIFCPNFHPSLPLDLTNFKYNNVKNYRNVTIKKH